MLPAFAFTFPQSYWAPFPISSFTFTFTCGPTQHSSGKGEMSLAWLFMVLPALKSLPLAVVQHLLPFQPALSPTLTSSLSAPRLSHWPGLYIATGLSTASGMACLLSCLCLANSCLSLVSSLKLQTLRLNPRPQWSFHLPHLRFRLFSHMRGTMAVHLVAKPFTSQITLNLSTSFFKLLLSSQPETFPPEYCSDPPGFPILPAPRLQVIL